jgi:hypothetical protein
MQGRTAQTRPTPAPGVLARAQEAHLCTCTATHTNMFMQKQQHAQHLVTNLYITMTLKTKLVTCWYTGAYLQQVSSLSACK